MAGPRNDDAAYAAVNAAILERAQALGRETGQDVCAVIVWDGKSRGKAISPRAFAPCRARRGWRVMEVLTLRTCFVVQGFGEKTDLSTGRCWTWTPRTRSSRKRLRRRACVASAPTRSSIPGRSTSHVRVAVSANLVIADLSTYNVNAAYELGVRYGVRPSTTMIVAENQFKNPFDVGHIVTLPYEHLGKDIGRRRRAASRRCSSSEIRALMAQPKADSPVYTFLPLRPPAEIR